MYLLYSNARFARARARARMCARAVEYINMFKTLRTTISQIYSLFGEPDRKLFSNLYIACAKSAYC